MRFDSFDNQISAKLSFTVQTFKKQNSMDMEKYNGLMIDVQDQDQDSLLVKRRNDNHSPGPVIRELVPSSHQRSELSNAILCIFSG